MVRDKGDRMRTAGVFGGRKGAIRPKGQERGARAAHVDLRGHPQ